MKCVCVCVWIETHVRWTPYEGTNQKNMPGPAIHMCAWSIAMCDNETLLYVRESSEQQIYPISRVAKHDLYVALQCTCYNKTEKKCCIVSSPNSSIILSISCTRWLGRLEEKKCIANCSKTAHCFKDEATLKQAFCGHLARALKSKNGWETDDTVLYNP